MFHPERTGLEQARLGELIASDGDVAITYAPTDHGGDCYPPRVVFLERDPATGVWSTGQEIELTTVFLKVTSLAIEGDVAVVGDERNDPALGGGDPFLGSIRILRRDPATGVWAIAQTIVPSGPLPVDSAGSQVAISGDRVVARDKFERIVRVYRFDPPQQYHFLEAEFPIAQPGAFDTISQGPVAIRGDEILLGSRDHDVLVGQVEIHRFDPITGTWSFAGVIANPAPLFGDEFGSSLAIEGNRLLVSSRKNPDGLHIFEQDSVSLAWLEVTSLPTGIAGPIALDGDRLATAIGAPSIPPILPAAVQVHARDPVSGLWSLTHAVSKPTNAIGGWGEAIALSGDDLLVGIPGSSTVPAFLPGHVQVYALDPASSTVTPTETLEAAGTPVTDRRVFDLELDADRAAAVALAPPSFGGPFMQPYEFDAGTGTWSPRPPIDLSPLFGNTVPAGEIALSGEWLAICDHDDTALFRDPTGTSSWTLHQMITGLGGTPRLSNGVLAVRQLLAPVGYVARIHRYDPGTDQFVFEQQIVGPSSGWIAEVDVAADLLALRGLDRVELRRFNPGTGEWEFETDLVVGSEFTNGDQVDLDITPSIERVVVASEFDGGPIVDRQVRVLRRIPTPVAGWTMDPPILDPYPSPLSGLFGSSVAISGDYLVIGAGCGLQGNEAQIYRRFAGTGNWAQVGTVTPSFPVTTPGCFGTMLELSEDRLLGGARGSPAVPDDPDCPPHVDGFVEFFDLDLCELPPLEFRRGDTNDNGGHEIGDAITILTALFSGIDFDCASAADVNGDAALNVADAIALLDYLFLDGPPPGAPFPDCGVATGPQMIECVTIESCP